MKSIYPIVVPRSYFDLSPEMSNSANLSLDAFGIVRSLGNDLFSLLVQVDDKVLKNIHEDDLMEMGLDRADAERAALANLSVLAASGQSIQRRVNETPDGFNFALWVGERFTSSCILWPGLFDWAHRELKSDQLIVTVPQVQLMCVAARGTSQFRAAMKLYLEEVVNDMDHQISTEWFELTPEGISPLVE